MISMSFQNCDNAKKSSDKDETYRVDVKTDKNNISYETVTNDPTGLRLYTLDNGLKVYLSKNSDAPKIQTYIAVKAGSNYDPKQSTGLAHYLEHMLFKGTDKIGTLDWEKEKEFIAQISQLYEEHRAESNAEKKLEIYKKIDSVSQEASNYAVANEYDKMTGLMGATGTNAHTWFEETIYKNQIPSNELMRWLDLEAERFGKLTLRLFHTELEAVFEEFNRGQDDDFRKSYAAMLEGLFSNHPYGQQTTIGKAEHLKNPSLVDINNYFNTYYVPNNMALVLVGDLDFDTTIEAINNTFGKFEKKPLTHPELPKEQPIQNIIKKDVFGPTSESVSIAYRCAGINSEDTKMVTLCNMILSNGVVGLIDVNVNQKQAVLDMGSYTSFLNDYGYHVFSGVPNNGQSLDDVKDLILREIDNLKKGHFESWMIEAVVNNFKKDKLKQNEDINSVATGYYNAVIHDVDWASDLRFSHGQRRISKTQLVEFANTFYKDNYVITYKRQGEDSHVVKVANPEITPVNLNREKSSDYLKAFHAKKPKDVLSLEHIDYEKAIKETETKSGIDVSYIENNTNDLCSVNFIFDMGVDHNKMLKLAIGYADYLGTDTYTVEALKEAFYKLGFSYGVNTGADQTTVFLEGLKENLPEAIKLLEHWLENVTVDVDAFSRYVKSIEKTREDTKLRKDQILNPGLLSYAKYGENSRLRNVMSIEAMKAIEPQELVNIIKQLKGYKHRVFYYGKDVESVVNNLNDYHNINSELKDYPSAIVYDEKETGGHVYFVDYDMVQTEMLFLAKREPYNPSNIAKSMLFNTYFGSGLSSIVFQEIRESKSLAYSAYAAYKTPRKKENSNYMSAYIGTQANKMEDAIDAMLSLMTVMPESTDQFNAAKSSVLKKIASTRITKSDIFWSYENLKKLGVKEDNRQDIFDAIQQMTLEDLKVFFNNNVKKHDYTIMIIGDKKSINLKALEKFGKIEELDVNYLFNY